MVQVKWKMRAESHRDSESFKWNENCSAVKAKSIPTLPDFEQNQHSHTTAQLSIFIFPSQGVACSLCARYCKKYQTAMLVLYLSERKQSNQPWKLLLKISFGIMNHTASRWFLIVRGNSFSHLWLEADALAQWFSDGSFGELECLRRSESNIIVSCLNRLMANCFGKSFDSHVWGFKVCFVNFPISRKIWWREKCAGSTLNDIFRILL